MMLRVSSLIRRAPINRSAVSSAPLCTAVRAAPNRIPLIQTAGAAIRRFSAAPSDDSHSDFEPKKKPAAAAAAGAAGAPLTAKAIIERDISTHAVFLYMKGVPAQPQCGFSQRVCRILDHLGVSYGARNVLADDAIREGIKQYTDWPTIPQLFIDKQFIGGCDIVTQMFEAGELKQTLQASPNVKWNKPPTA